MRKNLNKIPRMLSTAFLLSVFFSSLAVASSDDLQEKKRSLPSSSPSSSLLMPEPGTLGHRAMTAGKDGAIVGGLFGAGVGVTAFVGKAVYDHYKKR